MKNINEFESISEFKRYAKYLVAENLDSAFLILKPIVVQNSEVYNSWILYKARHKDTQKFFNQNILNKDKIDQELNKIRSSVLLLIDYLNESDFQNMVMEVQLSEKLKNIQKELKNYEEKVINLTKSNTKTQKDKERIEVELEQQKKINDDKIIKIRIENERLQNLTENYEQIKKQVQANEALIDNLKEENKKLYESNKKLTDYESTIMENLQLVEKLKNEKQKLLNEIDNIREQEKNLIANKKIIDNLKSENLNLKTKNSALKNELKLNKQFYSSSKNRYQNKNLYYGVIGIALILLGFSIIQFISNQKLDKKLFSLNEEVEGYQHLEANEEISQFAMASFSPPKKNNMSEIETKTEKSNSQIIVDGIVFKKSDIKIGKESKIRRLYRVKSGERVNKIIQKFNMDISEFKKLNSNIQDLNNIKSGEHLKVFDVVTFKNHIVKSKETLNSIVKRYKMWTYEIIELNNLSNPNKLKVNQKLIVFKSKYY